MAYHRQAEDPNTPKEMLIQFACSDDWRIRYLVAGNSSTPLDALNWLADDANENVRYGVAYNPSTSAETLTKLAIAKIGDIRYWVLQHVNTPELVKLYLRNPDFAGLTLTEFLSCIR
jgi:hypothetical protein